jgi:hypothetical protein
MILTQHLRTRAIAAGGTVLFHLLAILLLNIWEIPSPAPVQFPLTIEITPVIPDSDAQAPREIVPARARIVQPRHANVEKPPLVRKSRAGRVLFSLKWGGGGKRRKVSGNLPAYPADVHVPAMAQIELVVSGTGVVHTARVLQRSHPRCDEVALREARLWKFEALPGRLRKTDQRCIVTMSFIPR